MKDRVLTYEVKGLPKPPALPLIGRLSGPGALSGAVGSGSVGGADATAKPDQHDELRLLVNSRHPIIAAETAEEERLELLVRHVAAELDVPLYEWTVTTGLARCGGAAMYNTDQPDQALANIPLIRGDAIFLLKDFARYCDNDKICRRLRDTAHALRSVQRSIVCWAASLNLPPEIASESAPFAFGLPGVDELVTGVKQVLAEVSR